MILQEELLIIANESIAPRIFRMVLQGEMILDITSPDQFLHIRVPSPDKILRRPISISEYNQADKTCVIIYRVEGAGLEAVSKMLPGQKLDVMGPLGNGFNIELGFPNKKALIVGGGIGTPPLVQLAKSLVEKQIDVTILLGFAQQSAVILEAEFLALSKDVIIVTDDGSYGRKGHVGLLLDELVLMDFDAIYACGSTGMLKAVDSQVKSHPNAYLSMEARMACGMGACYACVVPVTGDESGSQSLKVCDQGPVFKFGEVVI